jgi:hypothetical protein
MTLAIGADEAIGTAVWLWLQNGDVKQTDKVMGV